MACYDYEDYVQHVTSWGGDMSTLHDFPPAPPCNPWYASTHYGKLHLISINGKLCVEYKTRWDHVYVYRLVAITNFLSVLL